MLGFLKTEEYLRRYAERAGFDPEVRGTTTDYFFARSLVAAGMGISLIPSIALTPEIPGLRTVSIEPPGPIRHIGVAAINRSDRPHITTLTQALIEQATHPENVAPGVGQRNSHYGTRLGSSVRTRKDEPSAGGRHAMTAAMARKGVAGRR